MFGTQLAEQNDARCMSGTLFCVKSYGWVNLKKRMKMPKLLHCACIPDLSHIATNKKECGTVVVANSLEVWGCSRIKCRRSCLEVQKILFW